MFIAVLAVFTPFYAQAGPFSYIGEAFSTKASAQGPAKTYPHRESSLLVAALNPDPKQARGGGDIAVDDDSDLLVAPLALESFDMDNSTTGSSNQIARYVVRSGDNLSSIAKMFDVSVNTIRWSNDIGAGGVVRVGQELSILPIDGVRHVIKKGDTLASISKKYKGDITEIRNFNSFAVGDDLVVGEVVVIPDGVVVPPPAPAVRTTSANKVATYSGPAIDGFFVRPAPGPKTQGVHGSNGIDIGGARGTTVVAAAAGEVLIARSNGAWNGGYGNMIVIQHAGGIQTLYAHLSQVNVVVGETVAQGARIAAIGNTGRSTGPHLHFEVRGARNPF